MYCPECGKSIPDESKFCLHCGKPIGANQAEHPKPKFSDEPPAFITDVTFCSYGPTKKGFLGAVYRGFSVAFSLRDKSNRATRADGEVELQLSGIPRFKYQVKKEDFEEVSVSYTYPPGERKFLGCWLRHETPDIYDSDSIRTTEIWFKTADGKKLYGRDR